jgi:hypothetical protein
MPSNMSSNRAARNAALVAVLGIAAIVGATMYGMARMRSLADEESRSLIDRSAHLGEIRAFASQPLPPDWMECDGRPLDRYVYKSLYVVLGTRYGSPDASHFNLPDLRGASLGKPASQKLTFAIYLGGDDGLDREPGATQ